MAFTAVETTRITDELRTAFTESLPATKQVFLDASATYANNLTDFKAIVDTVTDALFNETAPTIAP
jgi:fatty acid/phospholipid biosynthesis enzyme